MKILSYIKEYFLHILVLVLSALAIVVIYMYERDIAYGFIAITTLITLIAFFRSIYSKRKLSIQIKNVSHYLDINQSDRLNDFVLPVVITKAEGNILWYNKSFSLDIIKDKLLENENISSLIGRSDLENCNDLGKIFVTLNSAHYYVYVDKIESYKNSSDNCFILYFVEITDLYDMKEKYIKQTPLFINLDFDNFSDILDNFKTGDATLIKGQLENIIENWSGKFNCLMNKVGDDAYLLITESQYLDEMIEDKFSFLDKIREFKYKNKDLGLSISGGVSTNRNIIKADEHSYQALDLAKSRGGDQVVIKNNNDIKIIGGLTDAGSKRTKSKIRLVSSTIVELVENSDIVYITGHCYSDLDSIGGAVGIHSWVSAIGKEAKIVVNRKESLALKLIDYLEDLGFDGFISPEDLPKEFSSKALLVVVDSHRADFLEVPDLYKKINVCVVIDHHRKTIDAIDNAMIFYNEISASSVCEMVTELIQYSSVKVDFSPYVAEALLSGIMLDTRNFVFKTSASCFEAAAYLKQKGANMINVRKFFSNDITSYKKKNAIMSNSEIYKNCVIGYTDERVLGQREIRILSSQVADELLYIPDVKASFVVYPQGENVSISARSLGEMNVQVMMENLGGGGHLTMAATSLENVSINKAIDILKEQIDKYFEN
ncbi:MAG: DHH family phosphoesterase [Clostridia bacterium]|nr:DHH family phosphoesterase [Clostridia bacterium]